MKHRPALAIGCALFAAALGFAPAHEAGARGAGKTHHHHHRSRVVIAPAIIAAAPLYPYYYSAPYPPPGFQPPPAVYYYCAEYGDYSPIVEACPSPWITFPAPGS